MLGVRWLGSVDRRGGDNRGRRTLVTLLPAHYIVGLLLIPPVALKLLSTGYRFAWRGMPQN